MMQHQYASLPPQSGGILGPIRRLAPHWPILAVVSVALLAVSGVAGVYSPNVWQFTAGVIGGNLGILALVCAGFAWSGRHGAISVRSNPLAVAFAADPDPIVITDPDGQHVYVNNEAQHIERIEDYLSAWCVSPQETIGTVLSELRHKPSCNMSFERKSGTLRIFAYLAGEHIIWRFRMDEAAIERSMSDLELPIVSLMADKVIANHAAREIFDDQCLSNVKALDASAVDAGKSELSAVFENVTQPDGRNFVPIPLKPQNGRRDIVFLPDSVVDQIRGHDREEAVQAYDFEQIPVAMVELDSDGRVVGTNRLARVLLGLVAGEQRPFWEIVEGLGRPVADWLEDARAGRALGRPEVLRGSLCSQETFVQIILRRAVGADASGNLIAVISDATELKSLEARFVQSQKMQAIGQLAGGVAHDFNNLLTAISGHCDLLLLNRDRFDPDYGDLLQIHQNSNRAAALVRQLLAFSRKQTLKPETFLLESLLEDLIHLLTRLVGERITLTLSHDADLSAVRADRRQLEQVVMNLVVNARDAMPMGGTIKIETEARALTQETEFDRVKLPAGDYAVIRVIDSGVGIPASNLTKIFEPFFTTKRLGEGTGLGLSTAYGIVKQMGGYIFVESEEGTGTTFSIFFAAQDCIEEAETVSATQAPVLADRPFASKPQADLVTAAANGSIQEPLPPETRDEIAKADTNAATAEIVTGSMQKDTVASELFDPHETRQPSAPETSVKSGTILLVEDEAPVRAFAARALRMQGYQVFEAQDGEQALEFLAESTVPIDLFVSDVVMPGIDGPGWITQALATRPNTPVVFVSGYAEDALSASLVRIPRAVFLGKPFSLKDLSTTIEKQIAA